MLSAQKQETPPGTSSPPPDSRSSGGFGKVISSLQGLQQRLEDFSVDDLIKAETNAQTLIRRLIQFQDKLATLAELKNSIVSATEMVAQIPQPDFDLVNLDSLAKHPQLHSFVKAGKLIRFLKLVKATKQSAELNAVGIDEMRLPDATSTVNSSKEKSGLPAMETRAPVEELQIETVENEITPPAIEPVEDDRSTTAAQFDYFSHESLMSSVESQPAGSLELDSMPIDEIADVPALIEPDDAALPVAPLELESATPSDPHSASTISADSVPDRTVVEHTDAEYFAHAPELRKSNERDDVNPAIADNPQELASPAPQRAQANHHNAGSFDQRLLDDVIKNYGEFKTLADIPAAADLPNRAKPEFEDTRIAPAPEVIDIEISEASVEASAEQPPLRTPANFTFEVDSAAPSVGRLPSVRKDGDLDRQLKKIIKDYGEYDLYSNQSPVNLKTAGIAAFVVLGLVFGGIYFFRTLNLPPTPPAARVSSSPATATKQTAEESREESRNGGEKTDAVRDATNAAKRSQNKNQ